MKPALLRCCEQITEPTRFDDCSMKDKLRLIDVSILSSYMGRALTVVVTIFVVGIAISALVQSGGSDHGIIRVCVPAQLYAGDAVEAYEPFRALLSRETRRPVELVECGRQWPEGFDVYVMPIDEYLRYAPGLDALGLYEIKLSERRSDKAVIISRPPETDGDLDTSGAVLVDFAGVLPHEVAFSHPLSVNGFWLQAAAMVGAGFEMPGDVRELRFEGSRREGGRVVYGVLFGTYRLGACKLSEIVSLSERGIIEGDELRVIHTDDVLPELVVAVRRSRSRYFGRKIGGVARLLDEPVSPARQDHTVELLKSYGICRLDPVEESPLERAEMLFRRFGTTGDSPSGVSP